MRRNYIREKKIICVKPPVFSSQIVPAVCRVLGPGRFTVRPVKASGWDQATASAAQKLCGISAATFSSVSQSV